MIATLPRVRKIDAARQDAGAAQLDHPALACGWCRTDRFRQLSFGQSAVRLKRGDDPKAQFIHRLLFRGPYRRIFG